MAYPASLDELTDGVPSDGNAATTDLGDATYPHDDHHRALAVAVEAVEAELGTDPSGASATVKARLDALDTTVDGKVAKSLVDAAGDLIYATAADTVARLPLGTAGKVLTVNSGATAPEWAAAAGGSGGGGLFGPILAPGKYTFPPGIATTRATTVNYCWVMPFPIEEDCTIDRLAVEVTATAASTSIRLGLYSDVDGQPGSVLCSGTVDPSGSTGTKEATVSQAVTAGRVWFAVHPTGSNTPTLRGFTSGIVVPSSDATAGGGWPADQFVAHYMASSDSAALPATFTVDGSTYPAPRPIVRRAA